MQKQKENPLKRYLRKSGLSQREFAERMSGVTGFNFIQSDVSRWSNTVRSPNRMNRRVMAAASGGVVSENLWDEYVASLEGDEHE